jgi:hypothetical protein
MRILRTCLLALAATAAAQAGAAITYNANVTNAAIFGSGNANGGFTVDTANNVELGLRAKVRYDIADDLPKNVFNSNGDGTYNHAAGGPAANPTRARWNFEWSVNSDQSGTQGRSLSALSYVLGMDYDPSVAKSYSTVNLLAFPFDHSFGTNATTSGNGIEGNAQVLATTNNLMQNSWNLDFFDAGSALTLFGGTFNPSASGEYSFFLEAFSPTGGPALARTEITVIVGDGATQIPEPGSLALVGLGLLGAFAARRRIR